MPPRPVACNLSLASIASRALGMLDVHGVFFCSFSSFQRFPERSLPQRRQGRPQTRAKAQGKQPRRPARLDRETGSLRIDRLQESEFDLQTLHLCKPEWGDRESYLVDLSNIFRMSEAIFRLSRDGRECFLASQQRSTMKTPVMMV
jgi:hypothetical protein